MHCWYNALLAGYHPFRNGAGRFRDRRWILEERVHLARYVTRDANMTAALVAVTFCGASAKAANFAVRSNKVNANALASSVNARRSGKDWLGGSG